ncbi:MAG: polysaccharide deacetylase family protein [Gammaproteobacteria bacterium]|nr:polysaccharide deacetylase family protein [Gammaproteobacteria bacterium]MCH9764020.1 polysaccharide deacetylase family protein [Gammaproteobacteria bacterium]
MLKIFSAGLTFLILTHAGPCFSDPVSPPENTEPPIREIAITLDDLPFVSSVTYKESALKREHDRFLRLVNALVGNNVPATGFVIGGAIKRGQWELLEIFHNAGLTIGNHTFSHANLNSMSSEKYIENIAHADKVLTSLLSHPKYFRYPYLAEGHGEKKARVLQYLSEHDYIVAPVTIDTKDFRFNSQLYRVAYRARPKYLPKLKKQYLNYIWKQTLRAEKRANGKPIKQIILLHANLINSHFLGDIIQMYRDHGYRFISLAEALDNPEQPTPAGNTKMNKAKEAS